ncbi:right-handed parallel beta-helix repeat-containing protein [Actomonas aquatica]|uniref:Right-handed parallel beta-helix repeat-containing protein n=1 Tax=Actomonas aquatica TaxID=2866162 RepID=A0ABZ1CAS9_9BACT|nr:right-handed parallel beta-helix repeat-containing protein [Opitutus sp. WL0086]WRQ87699.1 right-handed parallel beta-helix repeat-containing protein [Opitutus sp. WL0086]
MEAARDRIRELRQTEVLPEGVIVRVEPGVIERSESFVLTAEDSGHVNAPIVWTAAEPGRTTLAGGTAVHDFAPVQAVAPDIAARLPAAVRDQVLVIDLAKAGVSDPGEIEQRGSPGLELFFDDQRMPLARYPNEGWLLIADVPQTGPTRFREGLEREKRYHGVPAGRHYGRITYDGDRPSRWSTENDIVMHGYWTWDWSDSYQKVQSIDTAAHEITFAEPHHNYGYTTNQRYRVLNVIEELDQPGEWCIDREAGLVYFLPPSPVESGTVYVSVVETPLVQMDYVSYVEFSGFELTASRGMGIQINGGEAVTVAGCSLTNLGGTAVEINGGWRHTVQSCDMSELARGGIWVDGGDRATLTPSAHRIVNNHIHDFSLWVRTNLNGITVRGVGQYVAHNLLHDGPHTALYFRGNDHLIELNELHDVCQETGDAGAIYTGRDYTWQGNVVRHNYLHDLKGPGQHGVTAVYLDDFSSGYTVTGNVFYRAGKGVQVGGGHDNTVTDNIFVDCEPAIHLDARGLGWASYYHNGTNTWLWDRMADLNAEQPPYSERYPHLRTILQEETGKPTGNVIDRNLVMGETWLVLFDYWAFDFHGLVEVEDNWVSAEGIVRRLTEDNGGWDPYYLNSTTDEGYSVLTRDEVKALGEFTGNRLDATPAGTFDPVTRTFTPTDPAALRAMGFELPPIAEMGLQRDAWRTRLPAR